MLKKTQLKLHGWSSAQRRLHWLLAFLIGLILVLGVSANRLAGNEYHDIVRFTHQCLGIFVLVAGSVRLYLRWRHPRPAWPECLPIWQRVLIRLVQLMLYTLVVLLPVLGLALSNLDPFIGFSWSNEATAGFEDASIGGPIAVQQWAVAFRQLTWVNDEQLVWIENLHLAHYLGAYLLLLLSVLHIVGALTHYFGPARKAWRQIMR